jgi:hypothetical protein
MTASFIYQQGQNPVQRFEIESIKQRVNIIRDMVNYFRHKINGLKIPMTHDYLKLLLFDVIGYIPKVLEHSGVSFMDWIIYGIKINIRDETIELNLIERKTSVSWNNPPPN